MTEVTFYVPPYSASNCFIGSLIIDGLKVIFRIVPQFLNTIPYKKGFKLYSKNVATFNKPFPDNKKMRILTERRSKGTPLILMIAPFIFLVFSQRPMRSTISCFALFTITLLPTSIRIYGNHADKHVISVLETSGDQIYVRGIDTRNSIWDNILAAFALKLYCRRRSIQHDK